LAKNIHQLKSCITALPQKNKATREHLESDLEKEIEEQVRWIAVVKRKHKTEMDRVKLTVEKEGSTGYPGNIKT